MKYADGETVHLGDELKLWGNARGIVVCSIETDEYSERHPRSEWEYLAGGILVDVSGLGLVHIDTPDASLAVVRRASGPG
ncbi:MAG TPA: hypothetical protein VEB21_12390 [Terriglobales bacterium]|nr:hypothetical protein [Terriglobales bacterium]